MTETSGSRDAGHGEAALGASTARRFVDSGGLPLAVWEGPRNGPTIVLVHGFPDTHVVWERVVGRLADRFHCVLYDVRGAGESGVPTNRDGYRMQHLRDDLVAVLDAAQAPGAPDPVHLVGHDWGSLQGWDAVVRADSEPRLAGRIATYTTISGPCLDHLTPLVRTAWRGGWTRRREVLHQLLHSWYVFAFWVPVLPELVLRRISRRLVSGRQRGSRHFADTLPEDAAHGVNLYRANIGRRPRVPGGPYTDVPVQLIVPLRDAYVTPAVFRDLHRFVSDLTRFDLDAGHWAPYSHAEGVARLIGEFATSHPGRSSPRRKPGTA